MKQLFDTMGISLSNEQEEKFNKYYKLLIEWNKQMNLTSITELEEVKIKHFLDSAALLKFIDKEQLKGKTMIDVGTGAGFPGIPLAILCPELKITLLDSLAKRVRFLEAVANECGLENVIAVHGRAEDMGQMSEYREKYDYAVSRAVANLSTLSEYCIPFVKVGGYFLPYKSMKTDEEILEGENALSILKSGIEKVEKFKLPMSEHERSILFIHKQMETDKRYPRKAGKPTKKPL